jgi:hypothetical protein
LANSFVGVSFQILNIQAYASGYDPQRGFDQAGSPAQRGKRGPAAILNQNCIFEMGSNKNERSAASRIFAILLKNSFFLLPYKFYPTAFIV